MFSSIKYYWWGLVFVVSSAMGQTSSPGGLCFRGSEQPIDQRTSYSVFGDRVTPFSDHFSIEFKLALYPTTKIGYIIRIKEKQNSSIYNLFYDGQGNQLTFRFNEEGKNNLISASLDPQELMNMPWVNMKIFFDLKADSIHLTIHNRTFSARAENLPEVYAPIILFGKSNHIIDVPSFAVKDLSVGNEEKFEFELTESEGTVVHDQRGKEIGEVSNPDWLINDAYHWRFKIAMRSRSVAGANYNADKKEFYYFNKDSLRTYNVRSGEVSVNVFEEKNPVRMKLGTNFLNTKTNTLYSYEPYNDDYHGPSVASLGLGTQRWTAESSEQLASPMHHHGGFFNPSTEQFTIFGGFGKMHYSKDFFTYDIRKKGWDTLAGFTGDFLPPRYFSSVGYQPKTNTVYIFGGMGNQSGEQIVGRQYYYDLYKIDLTTRKISKLWELDWKQDNIVPVRGMVMLNDSSFYTLCYPEHVSKSFLRLYRFSLSDGHYDILGDSIPIRSDKITTNANLYYDSLLNNFFAVVQEFDDDISSDLKIYSVSSPPLTQKELARYSKFENHYTLAIIVAAALLAAGTGYWVYRKRAKAPEQETESVTAPLRDDSGDKLPAIPARANAVYLFGPFTVRDKKNRDITYMFSEQLKQVFCLILQHSTTEDGIASQHLSTILWPDRPADKVKNSRGVTMNHLRKVLSELDGVELIHDKGHFKIVNTEAFYCDYSRCMQLIASGHADDHRDELVALLSRGKFLQLADHPVFDSIKDEMEKQLEPVLVLEMEKSFAAEQYTATLVFAQALSDIDPLNDAALTFHVKALQRMKKPDEARMRYQAFVVEYKKVMETEYAHPYKPE